MDTKIYIAQSIKQKKKIEEFVIDKTPIEVGSQYIYLGCN